MAQSEISKTHRNGKVEKLDASGLSFEFSYEDGDFSFGGERSARTVVYDRGEIVGLRKGNDPVLTASFTIDMRQFASGTPSAPGTDENPIDAIEWSGVWSAGVSTGGANFEFKVGTYRFTSQGIAYGETADHVLTCYRVLETWDFKEGDRSKISVKLEIYGGYDRQGPT